MSSEKTTSEKAASDFRLFLKDTIRKEVNFSLTDQSRGIKAPAIEKPCAPDARRVDLPKPGAWQIPACDQETMDHLLKLEGDQEFTVYLAPVGKVKSS